MVSTGDEVREGVAVGRGAGGVDLVSGRRAEPDVRVRRGGSLLMRVLLLLFLSLAEGIGEGCGAIVDRGDGLGGIAIVAGEAGLGSGRGGDALVALSAKAR